MQAAARNIAIVCNPLAGNGRAVDLSQKISEKLIIKEISHKIFCDTWPSHFGGFSDVFIVGGDGTLNYFINHYPELKIPLAIFKGGTGNDFHWMLYGSENSDQQIELVLSAEARVVDAGKCNDRYFMNGVGIGFDGAVAKSLVGKKKQPGKASFLLAIVKKIFTYHSNMYSISCDQLQVTGKKLMIGVANGRRAGGGFHIAPVAAADDGWLDAVVIDALQPFMRLRYLPVIEKGKHLSLPFIKYFKTKKIIIESGRLMDVHLDGEYYSSRRLEVEVQQGKFLFRY